MNVPTLDDLRRALEGAAADPARAQLVSRGLEVLAAASVRLAVGQLPAEDQAHLRAIVANLTTADLHNGAAVVGEWARSTLLAVAGKVAAGLVL